MMTLNEFIGRVEVLLRTEHKYLFEKGYEHDLDALVEATAKALEDVSTHEILVLLTVVEMQQGEGPFRIPFCETDFPYGLFDRDSTTIRDLLVWSLSDLISGPVSARCDGPAK